MSDIKLRYIIIDELSIKEYLTDSMVHDDNLLCDSLYKLQIRERKLIFYFNWIFQMAINIKLFILNKKYSFYF